MFAKYKVAHIGGITRYNSDKFRKVEKELTLQGYICFCPVIFDPEIWKPNKEMLDDMCYVKLLMCDLFVIATPYHIGESTKLRIKQCNELEIPIKVFNYETKELEDYIEGISYDYSKYGSS